MGLLDKIKNAFSGSNQTEAEFELIISNSLDEHAGKSDYFWDIEVNKFGYYQSEIVHWSNQKKLDFVIYCIQKVQGYNQKTNNWSYKDTNYQKHAIRQAYLKHLFKTKLTFVDTDINRFQELLSQVQQWDWNVLNTWPFASFIRQLEVQYKDAVLSELFIESLTAIKNYIGKINNSYYEKEKLKLIERIDSLLFQSHQKEGKVKPAKFLGEDPFSTYANPIIDALPEEDKHHWFKLIALAQKASGSKPGKKYLDETKNIIKALGADKFKKIANDWFTFLINLKEAEQQHSYTYNDGSTYNYTSYDFLSSVNLEAIKGMVWTCSHFHDKATVYTIANLADRCFRKIPGKGPAAASIGNACLYTLYKSKGLEGIGQLSRLKLRIKQSSTQNLIEKYLSEAASEQGVSIHEVEDLAVNDYGLIKGCKEVPFDDYRAEVAITGIGKSSLRWFKADGAEQKSIPAFVKERHAAKLKKLKESAKQIDQTTSAQRDRIDRMFRADRRWSMENFRTYYLDHGLMGYFAGKLIWNFDFNECRVTAICINNQWINSSNEIVSPDESSTISLWHPATATVEEIRQWRDFLTFHKIQQPLKQAFREVYLLTDAEINTKTYSNRMAAHVLKQHQFNSLAKIRGWKYSLMGAYDDGRYNEAAEVRLPEHGLKAEYWINEINADGAFNDTGIWNFIATDQIRFVNIETNEVVDLIEIPAIPFSEVLRDVDLFVGVASVGNDPTWQDTGGIPAYRDYWQSYSFGDLSEVAKMRKDILIGLIPRLKISKVAEIRDKFLVVKGKLRTYKIHIGSTNILMEPNDQYLCIVPDRSQKSQTENVFLPFEGDTGLSIILSKAFLLADDDKIIDSTITTQINRR
jgi:hypothetical protein